MSENGKGEVLVDGQNVVELEKLGISLMANEDKIIVMFDDYKSGYECKTCNAKGFTIGCSACDNMGKDRFEQVCKVCNGEPTKRRVVCDECKGKGGILVIPDTAKSLPTTGIVVSMGPETPAMKLIKMIRQAKQIIEAYKQFHPHEDYLAEKSTQDANIKNWTVDLQAIPVRLGARVIFGPHVGTLIPFKGNIKLKIMRVHEPLAVLFGKDTAARDFIDYETELY